MIHYAITLPGLHESVAFAWPWLAVPICVVTAALVVLWRLAK